MNIPQRIPYALVEVEVLKLYERGYLLTNVSEIEKHFELIMEFIQSCGWTTDEYTAHQFGWDKVYN